MQSNSTPVRSSTDSSNPRADMAAAAAFMMSFNNRRSMRVYRCAYCTRTFHSSQALGGHQNAHRRDRIVAREKFVQERIAFMTKQVNSFPPLLTTFPQPNPNFEHHQIITPPAPAPAPVVARSGPTYFDHDHALDVGFQPGLLASSGTPYVPQSVGFQTGLLGYGPQNEQLGFEMCLNPGPPSRAAAAPAPAFNNFPNDQACLLGGSYDYYNPYHLNLNNNNAYEMMNSAKKMKMERPWGETWGMEASSSNTAESHTNDHPKAENGGDHQDRKINEVTSSSSSSKKRAFIDLTYSP